jgi:hypothetical protein
MDTATLDLDVEMFWCLRKRSGKPRGLALDLGSPTTA